MNIKCVVGVGLVPTLKLLYNKAYTKLEVDLTLLAQFFPHQPINHLRISLTTRSFQHLPHKKAQ